MLYEALGGACPTPGGKPRPLHRCNPQVSVGLADVVGKCLADDPGDRYPDMAALADDLRRHLADLPLAGVRNRSLAERWRKWRRRRPHGVALAGMMLAVLTAAVAVAVGAAGHFAQRIDQARTALDDGQLQMAKGEWEGAIGTLQRGLSAARGVPFQRDLADELDRRLRLAERGGPTRTGPRPPASCTGWSTASASSTGRTTSRPRACAGLEASCRAFWESRDRIVERLSPRRPALEPSVRDDLLDLAIFWADLQVRLAPPAGKEEARRQALDGAGPGGGPVRPEPRAGRGAHDPRRARAGRAGAEPRHRLGALRPGPVPPAVGGPGTGGRGGGGGRRRSSRPWPRRRT